MLSTLDLQKLTSENIYLLLHHQYHDMRLQIWAEAQTTSLNWVTPNFFYISLDNSSPTNLHMCKVTFGSTSVDWAKKIICPTSSWSSYAGETLMSSDGSVMYTFFLYGDTASMYAHFVSLNPNSGGVIGTRYIK